MSTSVFDLFAKIKLDSSEYDKGLDDAERKGEGVGSKIAGGLATAGKAAAVALGAAATGVAALTKKSVESYAEYEQLVGGVETLFGAQGMTLKEYAKSVGKTSGEVKGEYKNLMSAQDTVMKNASEAYKTAGLSANEYMETVTSFAAALNASLGGNTEKSAKAADQAIRDMSDNANKMGSSMESIQNAYQGFAKQNYTMLDNLKLGYGGTKEEMQRLLTDAEKISGQKFDLSNYADIVEAIHVVQTEMGITGTTAKEAEKTISGSLAMTKSAWENLVTGFTNPDADLGALINNVVDSASKAFENLMPAITQAMKGIGSFVEQIAPVISEKIPTLVDAVLPPLLSAATSLVSGLVSALPGIATALVEQIPTVVRSLITAVLETGPQFIDAAHQIFDMLVTGINEALPTILSLAPTVVMNFINGFTEALPIITEAAVSIIETLSQGISTNLPILVSVAINAITDLASTLVENAGLLLDAGITLVTSIADGIMDSLPSITSAAMGLLDGALDTLTDNMPSFLEQGVEMITNLANGLLKALPKIIKGLGTVVDKLVNFLLTNLPVFLEKGAELIVNLANGLVKALPQIVKAAVSVVQKLLQTILSKLPELINAGFELVSKLVSGLAKALPQIITAALELAKGILDTITHVDWISLGGNIIKGIIQGLKNLGSTLITAMLDIAKGAFDAVADFFGIKSPSRLMRDKIGKNIVKGLIEGVDSEKKNAKKNASELGALYVKAAKTKFEELKNAHKLSLEEEAAFWLEVREHTKKGTQAYNDATKQVNKVFSDYVKERKSKFQELNADGEMSLAKQVAFWQKTVDNVQKGTDAYKQANTELGKAKKKLNEELENLATEYTEGVDAIIKNLDDEIAKLEKTYTDAVANRKNSLMGQMNMFETFTPKEGKGKDDLIQSMISQVEGMANYTATMTALQARLGDTAPEFYEELAGMNVDQLETLKAISEMSDQELETYVGLYNAKQMMAKDRAVRDNEELKKQTDAQIEELKTNAQTQLDELEEKYKKGIKALGVNAKKEFKKAGKNAVKGMGEGMNTQFDKLEAQMRARAAALVAPIQAALKIHSPSKVFADEVGKFIPLGIAEGFEGAMPQAEKGILASVNDMKDSVAGALDFSGAIGDINATGSIESSPITMLLAGIYEAVLGMPDDMRESFGDALRNTTFSMNDREFARLVKAV